MSKLAHSAGWSVYRDRGGRAFKVQLDAMTPPDGFECLASDMMWSEAVDHLSELTRAASAVRNVQIAGSVEK